MPTGRTEIPDGLFELCKELAERRLERYELSDSEETVALANIERQTIEDLDKKIRQLQLQRSNASREE